jgi:uncharacterized damage-inducible protein DinB
MTRMVLVGVQEAAMARSEKQHFAERFEQEHGRTMRVLRAYPDDQTEFKPQARSRTAREVAWPLVLGQERLMVKALTTGFDWSKPPDAPPNAPAKMSEIAAAAEHAYAKAKEALHNADEARLGGTVQFFVAPKTLGDFEVLDFLYYILFDHIHHRGQLSVYLRMIGNVPAIYGPSGDEPWR